MKNYLYNLATDKSRSCGQGRDKYGGLIAGLVKALLLILAFIYGLIVRILIFFYHLRPYRLNCKVISVGNITLGGTGKTSLVEYIARYLRQEGHKVAILSRGYKRLGYRFSVVGYRTNTEHRTPNTETMGDEPYMLQMKLKDVPVIVDANRIRAAKTAILNYGVDTVILDDGLQQWRIKKDLEIVTVDVTDPFGNRHMIPRGILRQPLSSLKCVDILVLTKTNLNPDYQDIKDFLSQINPEVSVFESIHNPCGFYKIGKNNEIWEPEVLKEKSVAIFSGIGDPDSFENLITSLGINMGLSFRFPDHYPYSQKDLDNIVEESRKKNIDALITTEKDAVRLSPYLLPTTYYLLPILVLRIELKITKDEQGFHNRLLRLYSV